MRQAIRSSRAAVSPVDRKDDRAPPWFADCQGRRGKQLSGQFDDFQRTHDASAVGIEDRGGRLRVHLGKQTVHRCDTDVGKLLLGVPGPDKRIGGGKRPVVESACTYSIDPPTMTGVMPVPRSRSMSAGCVLVARDGRRLGDVGDVELMVDDAARSATGGLAVPMSMPRYWAIASTLTIWPPSRSAISRPTDLPLAWARRSRPAQAVSMTHRSCQGSPCPGRPGCDDITRRQNGAPA